MEKDNTEEKSAAEAVPGGEAPAIPDFSGFLATCTSTGGVLHGGALLPGSGEKPVLLVSHELSLTGAPVVLLYMAQTLKRLGMQPMVISPKDGPLRTPFTGEGIPVATVPALFDTDLISRGAELFSLIVLNTAASARAADMLNGAGTPVLWWIHEAEVYYNVSFVWEMPYYLHGNIRVVTAGPLAGKHLLDHRAFYPREEFLYWIPDAASAKHRSGESALFPFTKGRKVFALVGSVESRKGQDILLDAIELLPEETLQRCCFVFVGQAYDRDLAGRIREAIGRRPESVQYIPQIEREKMPGFYTEIDCLICASRDDPMPVVVTEACQFSKIVICSEHTGSARFLEQHEAGLVYRGDDPDALAECIRRVCGENGDEFKTMRHRAREVYLMHFSAEAFEKKLREDILPWAARIGSEGVAFAWSQRTLLPEEIERALFTCEAQSKTEAERGSKTLRDQEALIRDLETVMHAQAGTIEEREHRIRDLETHTEAQAGTIEEREHRVRELEAQKEAQAGIIEEREHRVRELEAQKETQAGIIEERERLILALEAQTEAQIGAIEDKNRQIRSLEARLQVQDRSIAAKRNYIQGLFRMIGEESARSGQKDRLIAEQSERLLDVARQLAEAIERGKQLEEAFQKQSAELANCKEHDNAAIHQRDELLRQLAEAQYAYSVISNAACWKMTAPLRALLDWLKGFPVFFLLVKGLKCLKDNGLRYTWNKVKDKLRRRQEYHSLALRSLFSSEELEKQRSERFERDIKFSIITPLYNTPEDFLHDMIGSVQDQTYVNWELCLADGSDAQHAEVERICRKYASRDRRIKYRKLKKNLGISGNSNACLEMSTGDYIGLLDHDDLLHPAALHEVMGAICAQDADFVYSDEATFESPNVNRIITAHYKPDFAPDNLRSNNYICHFSAFSKSLIERAGPFRPDYDGSQDHDLILRLTARAKKIVHLPKILYYWRSHAGSVAQSISVKDYAAAAGRRAVKDSIEAQGLAARVESSDVFPAIYRLSYQLTTEPKVSIILTGGTADEQDRCIRSILEQTHYSNYEIIVVTGEPNGEDGSRENDAGVHIRISYVLSEGGSPGKAKNTGASSSSGDYLLFVSAKTEVLTPCWIEELLMYAQREDVGAAGAMLCSSVHTIWSAGIILGLGQKHIAANAFRGQPDNAIGYMGRLAYAQDLSAVSSGCMLVKRSVFSDTEGFDEKYVSICCDTDFCLRLRGTGHLIVWTPYARLSYFSPDTEGTEDCSESEAARFRARWGAELTAGDPYYNPNFSLERSDFALK